MARNRTNNVIFHFKDVFVPMSKHERWRKQVVDMKLSREARNRLEWMIYYETVAKKNASLTSRHFGVASKTFYKWKSLFDEKNLRTMETRSKAPKRVRQKQITPLEEERVVAIRRTHMRWGKVKLAKHYENIYRQTISSWKVQYTVEKYKLYHNPKRNAQTQAKRKRSKAKKRITELKKQPFPGFLLALDTIVIWWNGLKRYIVTGIDVTSKIAFARMYTTKSSKNAADFLQRMTYLLDHEVWNTLHDNGSEFYKYFANVIKELGLDEYWSREHTPKDNPVCERFNRTLKEEFISLGNMNPDPLIFNRNLTEWLVGYNFVRPHQTLDYLTPWQYYEKANKLLPMYSSRTEACTRTAILVVYTL